MAQRHWKLKMTREQLQRWLLLCTLLNFNGSWQLQGSHGLTKFLTKLKFERDFQTLLILTEDLHGCVEDNDLAELNVTLLLFSDSSDCAWKDHNRKVLVLRCVPAAGAVEVHAQDMQLLSCLGRLRKTRIVFYWHERAYDEERLDALLQLFSYCTRNFLFNVIGIFKDFATSERFYTYEYGPFPMLTTQSKPLSAACFPNRVTNLNGSSISTLPDQNEPRSIVYRDADGVVHLRGYVVQLVQAFASKHNATLVHPLPVLPERIYNFLELFNMTKNGTLDMPMTLASPVRMNNPQDFSVIVEQTYWRPMIPLAAAVPVRMLFRMLFGAKFVLILVLLVLASSIVLTLGGQHWRQRRWRNFPYELCMTATLAVPGVLGQATQLPRTRKSSAVSCTYACLFMAGIFVGTFCSACLKTFLTSSPRPSEITSFQQLSESSLKVRISSEAHNVISLYSGSRFWNEFKHIFTITPNVSEFYEQRRSLNTQYAYSVTSSLWPVYAQQQARLSQPRFHLSEKMHFTRGLYLAIPLHEHSIYRESMNCLIRQVQESGLLALWQQRVFDDMLAANKVTPLNATSMQSTKLRTLTVSDFFWLWWTYAVGLTLAAVVLTLEQLHFFTCKRGK